jgi:hypothetical protein
MDVGAVAAALEDARFDARQDSRHEDLADDVRSPAELAEWERIAQLLADAAPGTVYDPDTDDVVQAELAADAAAAAAREPNCAKPPGSPPPSPKPPARSPRSSPAPGVVSCDTEP